MKLWKLLELVCGLLSLPMLGSLGVLTWIEMLGGPARFAWPAIVVLIGTLSLFAILQAISNDMQDAEIRKRYGR